MTFQRTAVAQQLTVPDVYPLPMLGSTPGFLQLLALGSRGEARPVISRFEGAAYILTLHYTEVQQDPPLTQQSFRIMKSVAFLAALASLLPAYVAAQAAEWGQCGGINWST